MLFTVKLLQTAVHNFMPLYKTTTAVNKTNNSHELWNNTEVIM